MTFSLFPHNQSTNIYQLVFILLCIVLLTPSCSSDAEEEEIPAEKNDYQIRPILSSEFLLIRFPISLLERSDCSTYREVTTDENGIFSLANYDGRDIILYAEDQGEDQIYVGTFSEDNLLQERVNDISMRESFFQNVFLSGTGIGQQALFSTADDIAAQYQLEVPNYPLEKIRLEILDNNFSLLQEDQLDQDGTITINLPFMEPGEHFLQLRFRGLGDVLILEMPMSYTVVQSFEANLSASVNECNAVLLSWNPYESSDFEGYVISYADISNDINGCGQLFSSEYIDNQSATSFTVTDYATTSELCFSLEVETSSGLSNKNTLTVEQPYGYVGPFGSGIEGSTLLTTGELYFQVQSGTELCRRDPNSDLYTCSDFNLNNSEIVFTGEVQGEFHYVTWDGNFRLLNAQNELKGFLANNSLSPQLHVTSQGLVASVDMNSFNTFKIHDFNKEISGTSNFEFEGEFSKFIDAPGENKFGVVTFIDDPITLTIQNRVSMYSIRDVNSVTLDKTFDLDYPFFLEGFDVSPNGRYLILNNGLIYDLSANNPRAIDPLPSNRYQVFSSDTHALFVDESQGKTYMYDYVNEDIVERDLCGGRVIGITANQGIFITKESQVAVLADVLK